VTSRWVPVAGAARRQLTRGSGARGAGPVRESGCLGHAVRCCVLLLICTVVVAVPSVCCSVKLPLSRPNSFLPLSFHSPPHRGEGRGSRVVLFVAGGSRNQNNFSSNSINARKVDVL